MATDFQVPDDCFPHRFNPKGFKERRSGGSSPFRHPSKEACMIKSDERRLAEQPCIQPPNLLIQVKGSDVILVQRE